jgi:uncharacterized protein YecT (DUF1311 family)
VVRALEASPPSPIHDGSEPAWRATVDATCSWAEELAQDDQTCFRTTRCVRLMTEARLAMIQSPSATARAADLLQATGRVGCVSGAEGDCAEDMLRAEEERLGVVLGALERLGHPPREAQRWWLAYRDASCEAEAIASRGDLGWARAACAGVATHRRTELLVGIAATAEGLPEPIGSARLQHALRRAGLPARVWQGWLAAQVDPLAARDRVREALEALEDGALYPPLVRSDPWAACESPGSLTCLREVRVWTRTRWEERVPADAAALEVRWRERWCGGREEAERLACEATIDLVSAP